MEFTAERTAGAPGWCAGCQSQGVDVLEVRIPFRKHTSPNVYFLDACGRCRARLEQAPELVRDEGIVNSTWGQVLAALSS